MSNISATNLQAVIEARVKLNRRQDMEAAILKDDRMMRVIQKVMEKDCNGDYLPDMTTMRLRVIQRLVHGMDDKDLMRVKRSSVQNGPKQAAPPIKLPSFGQALKLAQPISGIDECLRELKELKAIPKLTEELDTIRNFCKGRKDGMTIDMRLSVFLYTNGGPFYKHLTKALKSNDLDEIRPYYRILLMIRSAFNIIPKYEGTVFRYVPEDLSDDFNNCKEFIDTEFVPCFSIEKWKKREEQNKKNPKTSKQQSGTLFSISSIRGIDISSHSMNDVDEDILLFPCARFKVTGVIKREGEPHFVTLQHLHTPHPDSHVEELRKRPTKAVIRPQ